MSGPDVSDDLRRRISVVARNRLIEKAKSRDERIDLLLAIVDPRDERLRTDALDDQHADAIADRLVR